jgi:NitT/TauT family transport system substrate-binding protein
VSPLPSLQFTQTASALVAVRTALLCVLIATAGVGPSRADEQLRVGVSVPAAIAFVPLQVGIETGIFKRYGLKIIRADLGGAARAHQALAAGSLDLVVAGGPDLSLVAKGEHALAVGVITTGPRQTTLIVRNDNPMRSPEELKGKTIGISTAGGLSDWVVRQLSRRLGFGPQGIKAVGLGQDSGAGRRAAHGTDRRDGDGFRLWSAP